MRKPIGNILIPPACEGNSQKRSRIVAESEAEEGLKGLSRVRKAERMIPAPAVHDLAGKLSARTWAGIRKDLLAL